MKSIFAIAACAVVLSACHSTQTDAPSTRFPQTTPGEWLFYAERAYPKGDIDQNAFISALEAAKIARQTTKITGNWELIGPTDVGGRVTSVAMHPNDTTTLYIGAASGGVFKSYNRGKNWQAIFDEQLSLSIGDIAIAPTDPKIIYVGTGEANAGGGSITYDGIGIFKSFDGGRQWHTLGLKETRNIAKIIVHPQDENTVYVGAMGSLFSNNAERGVFKTDNGGQSWEKVLYVSDSTGCVDLAIHPQNPNILYAAMWERVRRPDRRQYGGETCGIYRSLDGGKLWTKLGVGLPSSNLGRIGITISPSHPDILYAIYADESGYFSGIFKTLDGGNTWCRVADGNLAFMYESYGWWFGKIEVAPNDPDNVFALGLDLYQSKNGGDNWRQITSDQDVHIDQHSILIHPAKPNMVVLGNDGGVYISQNNGRKWTKSDSLPITQFYSCSVDPHQQGTVYGGTQDNGVLKSSTDEQGKINWELVLWGDGLNAIIDPEDPNFVYTELQYGDLFRSEDGGQSFSRTTYGIDSYDRKNWRTPFLLNPLKSSTLYYGSERLYQSHDRAETWRPISPDLTDGQRLGNLIYGTITAIAVAPADTSVIYIGTDDGNVWITKNSGRDWQSIANGLPNRWVTSIAVHPLHPHNAYITFSGYRYTDQTAHVFETVDSGLNWRAISGNLPNAPVNKIIINTASTNIFADLYVATDVGVFVTYNLGSYWEMLGIDLPNVPITDLTLDTQNHTLIVATYGRSMYRFGL